MSSHHAFLITGDSEAGIAHARSEAVRMFQVKEGSSDITILRYGLFSVEDARTLLTLAQRRPVAGEVNVIIISATRFFHEAQNALLKLFEEPPETTKLFLVVPSEGNIISTLRSRLVHLSSQEKTLAPIAEEFLKATTSGREKLISKLLDRAKSDKEEEKQGARADALVLLEGLMERAYEIHQKNPSKEAQAFLSDLNRFIPILHERSAPLKMIFEHTLLTTPRNLI